MRSCATQPDCGRAALRGWFVQRSQSRTPCKGLQTSAEITRTVLPRARLGRPIENSGGPDPLAVPCLPPRWLAAGLLTSNEPPLRGPADLYRGHQQDRKGASAEIRRQDNPRRIGG